MFLFSFPSRLTMNGFRLNFFMEDFGQLNCSAVGKVKVKSRSFMHEEVIKTVYSSHFQC